MTSNALRKFDADYGWLLRYITPIILLALLALGSQYFVPRSEFVEKETAYKAIRQEDLRQLESRIENLRTANSANLSRISEMASRLSRIEAQNEIIIRNLEKLTQP